MSEAALALAPQNANNLELNKGDQFLFAIDVSGSMASTDCPGGQSRINFSKEQVKTFAQEAAKYDPDGADYYTFGHEVTPYLNQTADQAVALIDSLKASEGSTDTAGVIRAMWKRAQELRTNGVTENIVAMIITDGAPNDQEAVKEELRGIANSLPDGEGFGVIFLKVGNDTGVAQFLADIDDNLNAAHDIVDVKNLVEVNFLEAFVGAVHD